MSTCDKEIYWKIRKPIVLIIFLILAILLFRGLWFVFFVPNYSFFELKFSPDGCKLLSVSNFGHVFFWDWKKGELFSEISKVPARDISFSPCGKYYAFAGFSGVKLYKSDSRDPIFQKSGICGSVDFTNDGKKLVFSSSREILIWDIDKQKYDGKINLPGPPEDKLLVATIKSSYGNSFLVSGFDKLSKNTFLLGTDEILDWQDLIIRLKEHKNMPEKRIWDLLYNDSRNLIDKWHPDLPVDEKMKFKLVKELNRIIKMKKFYKPEYFKGRDSKFSKTDKRGYHEPLDFEICRFNRRLIESIFQDEIASYNSGIVKLWDIESLKCVRTFHLDYNVYEISTRGNRVFVTCYQKELICIDVKHDTQKVIKFKEAPYYNTFSQDGKLMAYPGKYDWRGNRPIKVFDLETSKEILKIPGINNLRSMAFSPDNKVLAVGSIHIGFENGEIKLFDIKTGRKIKTLKPSVDFSESLEIGRRRIFGY